MEQVKEAFSKVKQDIDSLKKEVLDLNKGLTETRGSLIEICEVLKGFSKRLEETNKKEFSKDSEGTKKRLDSPENQEKPKEKPSPTYVLEIPTQAYAFSTDSTTQDPQKPLKAENYSFSTGNEGVPTDRQTDQQTDQHIEESSYNKETPTQSNSINNAAQILESLDNLKKEIRLKFKRLTDQEFSVFSTIYQLSEEFGHTDYKNLSEKLNLTESSIRDYVGRLIKKGIPLDKTKLNNKTVYISVSQNLKKVASLPTILQLRAI